MDDATNTGLLRAVGARPWAVALTYLLLAIVFAALGTSGLWDTFSLIGERGSSWYTLATAVPACGAVLLKQRAPGIGLALAGAIFVADILTFGGLVPLLVLLELMNAYLLTLNAEQRKSALAPLVAVIAAFVIAALLLSGSVRTAMMVGLQFGALMGLAYWYANSIAQSRELVQLHRQRSEAAERLAVRDREAAVQSERDRMARELHDVVAGHIAAVAIRSEAALGLPRAESGDSAELSALRAVRDSSLEAHAALRSMIQVLRSGEAEFEASPGRSRLSELVDAANASGVRAELFDEITEELPASVDQTIGRVVQEGLANSVRHASGARVEVRLHAHPDRFDASVVSRGGEALASPSLPGSGMGLELLRERVRVLGGTLHAGPEEDGVWAVRAELPRGADR